MSTSATADTKARRPCPPPSEPVVSGVGPQRLPQGDDYYLVTSTFEYLPGLPVYHSKDRVHWRHIGNALSRESQLTFPGRKAPRPSLRPPSRCQPDAFYIINTDVEGIGNFVINAKDPAGPWSDPVRIPEPEFGMDPSLLFDDDGTVYYTRHGGLRNGGAYQAIIDLKTGKLKEPRRRSGRAWRRLAEGPHLYKINGWYYLMIAEGGVLRAPHHHGPPALALGAVRAAPGQPAAHPHEPAGRTLPGPGAR